MTDKAQSKRDRKGGPSTTRTTTRQKLALVAFGATLFIALLALAELGLSLFDLGDPYLYEDPYVGFAPGQKLFRLDSASGEFRTAPAKLAFFNEQSFPARKSPDTVRIFTLGGSTTAGRPYDHQVAFARWLEIYLETSDPERKYEVINAGAISYASYRVAVLLEELGDYEPDAYVLLTGHNEFLEERSYGELQQPGGWIDQLGRWASQRRFFTLAQHALGKRRRSSTIDASGDELPSEVTARLDGWTGVDLYQRDDPLQEKILEHFEFNLRRMVALARNQGAAMFFVLPASNIKDFSPFKSEPDAGLAATVRRDLEQQMRLAESHQDVGEHERALVAWDAALQLDPRHANALYGRGRSLLALGRIDEAVTSLVAAKDEDIAPLRALEQSLQRMRRVASELQVPMVDLPAWAAQQSQSLSGVPLPGDELFLDHVHPDIPVHQHIARSLVPLLAEAGLVPPLSLDAERMQQLEQQWLDSLDRGYYAQRDLNLSKVLGWSGKLDEARAPLQRAAEIMPDHPEVRLNLGILEMRSGRPEAAVRELEQAVLLAPEMPETYFNLGVALGSLERLEEGLDALEAALRLRPDYAEAVFNRGVLLRRLGRYDQALEALSESRSLRPGLKVELERLRTLQAAQRPREVLALLDQLQVDYPDETSLVLERANALAAAGELSAARSALEEALTADPEHAGAWFQRAQLAAREGDPEAAIQAYGEAVRIDPDYAEAHNNLGILLAGAGRGELALAALDRAIEADPGYAQAHLNRAVVLDQAGQPAEALRAVDRALELEPDNARFLLAAGSLLLARGEQERGLAFLERARQLGAQLPAEIEALLDSARRPTQ